MSAAQAAARTALDKAQHHAGEADADAYPVALACVGVGRAVLAAAEELEALVELLCERLPVADEAPEQGVGTCPVCSAEILPGQAVAFTTEPDGAVTMRHGWCTP